MKNLPKYIDCVFCIFVLPIMALIFPVERWMHNFEWYVVTVGVWLYSLYFLNRFLTVPLLFKNSRKRWLGCCLICLSLIITFCLSRVSLYTPKPNIFDVGIFRVFPEVMPYQQAVWSLFMIVEAFSFAISLLTQANLQRARRRAVEAQRDKAEIELYKAQIKPHFMFNTLNSLYGLFLTGDEKALESLEKYISMLRYIHTTSRRDLVTLSEEADYIRQFVALQSLRLNEMTEVKLKIEIEDPSLQIPPMLLVTFVENCFKHGLSPIEESTIDIALEEKEGKLSFSTRNRIFPVNHIGEHLGIANCRKRLEMFYPDRNSLDISTSDDGKVFNVKLFIGLI